MKLIIAGSRTVLPSIAEIDQAFDAFGDFVLPLADVTEVISGGARGPDKQGELWAASHGIPVHVESITPEDIERYGKYLGPKMRNRRMAERGDAALILWDGSSGGSADMCTRMVARHKLVRVVPMKRAKSTASR